MSTAWYLLVKCEECMEVRAKAKGPRPVREDLTLRCSIRHH